MSSLEQLLPVSNTHRLESPHVCGVMQLSGSGASVMGVHVPLAPQRSHVPHCSVLQQMPSTQWPLAHRFALAHRLPSAVGMAGFPAAPFEPAAPLTAAGTPACGDAGLAG